MKFLFILFFTVVSSYAALAQGEVSVQVYATSWCGYCRALRADLKNETGSDNVVQVDGVAAPIIWIDGESTAARKAGVRGFPTTVVTSDDGKQVFTVVGYDLPNIKAAIRKARN